MWGQNLESESPEGQSPEAQVREVQQCDLILKGAKVQCQVSREFKSASPRTSPQIPPERPECREARPVKSDL